MRGKTQAGILGVALLLGLIALVLPAGSAATSAPAGETVLEVRFTGVSTVRGAGPNLRAESGETLGDLDVLLASAGATGLEPLVHGMTQADAGAIAREARESSGSHTPNMADWYRVTVPGDRAEGALAVLRSSPLVVSASRAPEPVPSPATPDFSPMQNHLDPSPTGTDAEFSLAEPRARGAGVTVVDLEYYWTRDHEDLQLPASSDLGTPSFVQYTAFNDEHGTAVFGIMAARDNGFGVTGGVPDATFKGISPNDSNGGYNPTGALVFLANRLEAGDVVLIEQQTVGPAGEYVPLEWVQSSFDAIRQLSDLGVIVVETSGNGAQDLDGANMLGRFDREVRDSGAILVAAGDSATHEPLYFSSYGSRMDLQGYGNDVVTTGGNGNLQGGTAPGNRNVRYTSGFNGTSSAGPVVTNAVVAVLSYLKATGQRIWSADEIRDVLRATGTPQGVPGAGQIGPLPDIRAALRAIEVDPPLTSATLSGGQFQATADDGWGYGVDLVEYRRDGGPWTAYPGPVPIGETVVFAYRATDQNGNVSDAKRISLDGTPPLVSVTGPADGSRFDFNSEQRVGFECSDAYSGIESCLANDAGPGASTPLNPGDRLPTDRPGSHTITIQATDLAGLTTTVFVDYEVGPGCLAQGVTLASAESLGSRTRLLGAADPSLSGAAVTVRRNGARAGRTTVGHDGTIAAKVPAPRSRKARAGARYQLVVGGRKSNSLSSSAAVRVLSVRPVPGGTKLVKAKVAGVRKAGRVTLAARPICGAGGTTKTVRHDRKGILTLRLIPADATQTFTLNKGGKKLRLPVVLPAARFSLGPR